MQTIFTKSFRRAALVLLSGGCLLWAQARADEVSLNLYARALKTAAGAPMPATGLVILVASTNDAVFGPPTTNSFTSGDDIELARWDLSTTGNAGELFEAVNGLALTGGRAANNPLAIYWFPSLNLNATAPDGGTPYGIYHDATAGADGSDPWVIPAAGGTVSLYFLTADTGSSVNQTNAGNASLVVAGPCPGITLSDVTNAFRNVKYLNPVVATPAASYTFTNVAGALPTGLTLTNSNGMIGGKATVYGIYNFTLMASNNATACTDTRSYTMLVNSSVPDITQPTVAIKHPTANAVVVTAPPIIVDGTLADAVLVTNVEYSVDGGGWARATTFTPTTFSIAIASLTPGLHSVSVRATDLSGNVDTGGNIKTVNFHYGTHSFVPQGGIYYGLFSEPAVAVNSAGFAKVTVTARAGAQPTFTAALTVAGQTVSGAGKFELDGIGTLTRPINRTAGGPLTLQLVLPLVDGATTMSGTVFNQTSGSPLWTAPLTANLSLTNLGLTKVAVAGTTYDGVYTVVLPGFDSTIGDGYASLTITKGLVTLSGKLADGQAFSQSPKVTVSPNGGWPLFVSGDKFGSPSLYHSLLTGWATVANLANVTNSDLVWIKSAGTTVYTNGFVTDAALEASAYGGDPGAGLVLPLTPVSATSASGNVYLFDGGLGTNIVNSIMLTNSLLKNKFLDTQLAKPYKLSLTLSPKLGLLTGSFKSTGNGVEAGTVAGVVMQNQGVGRGYFIQTLPVKGTNSGTFRLQ